VIVEADGIDLDTLPDPNPQAVDVDGPLTVNYFVCDLQAVKTVRVVDGNGSSYGPAPQVILPMGAAFPLNVTWAVQLLNDSEDPIAPDCLGSDPLLKKLFEPLLSLPPEGDEPDWPLASFPVGAQEDRVVTQWVADKGEFQILDQADNPAGVQDGKVVNTASLAVTDFLLSGWCLPAAFQHDDQAIIILPAVQQDIPAMNAWGVLAMAVLLGGLMILRSRMR